MPSHNNQTFFNIMVYKVKNLIGTGDNPPRDTDSWLAYWEQKTGLTARYCHAVDCDVTGRSNLVGAHVKRCDISDRTWYIVPLCRGCNQRTDEFMVEGPLVPAVERD